MDRQSVIGTTLRVLRLRRSLLLFPAISGLVISAVCSVPFYALRSEFYNGKSLTPGELTALAPVLLLIACLQTILSAPLLHAVDQLLRKRRPTVAESYLAVARRLPPFLAWALLNVVVSSGMWVLSATFALRLLLDAAGISWWRSSYFTLPAMIAEERGAIASLRRSRELGRRHMGNIVSLDWKLSALAGLLVLVPGITAVVLAAETDDHALVVTTAVLVALWCVVWSVLSATATGIYRMVVWHRAVRAEEEAEKAAPGLPGPIVGTTSEVEPVS